jgi:hypothetical protein
MMRTQRRPAKTVKNREESITACPAEPAKIGKNLYEKP